MYIYIYKYIHIYIWSPPPPQDLPMSVFNGIYSIKCLFLQKQKMFCFLVFVLKY